MGKKRGIFFSTDALIAMTIIFVVILIAVPLLNQQKRQTELHFDLLKSLSILKISEVILPTGQEYLMTNPNHTILEQIGEFYALGNLTNAKTLADLVTSNLNTNENIGIFYGNNLITSKNSSAIENAKDIETARLIITGIQIGSGVTGFSARAFLRSSLLNKYIYFGGYVGDGNITTNISYQGNISSAEIEVAISNDFEIFVNGFSAGNFNRSDSEFTPVEYQLSTTNFQSGENIIEIKGDNLHIAGGFIKIAYDSDVEWQQPTRYRFPGIEGLINLYDGMTIPGDPTDISVYLHMNSSFINTILNIGNVTVYNDTTDGEEEINLNKAKLESMGLILSELSNKTTPIRLGMEGSPLINVSLDIVSLTDKSNNMKCSVICQNCHASQNQCEAAGGQWLTPMLNSSAANTILVNEILVFPNTRVSVYGFHSTVSSGNKLYLTNISDCLLIGSDYGGGDCPFGSSQKGITEWDENSMQANSDFCDGIELGVREELETRSTDPETIKVGILQLVGTQDQCGQTPASGLDLDNSGTNDELEDLNGHSGIGDDGDKSVMLAWQLCTDLNTTIHTIGYGNQSDLDEGTLQAIVSSQGPCGGNYYYADIEGLVELYQDLIDDIIAEYQLQTVIISGGNGSIFTQLYSDSYIEFTYNELPSPFGLIITTEQQFSNTTTGSFSIPNNSTKVDATVVSYSGPKWTDTIEINNNQFYNLSNYGNDYIALGDPYTISIPLSLVEDSNNVSLAIASSPQNQTEGSIHNKIIYTISKEIVSLSAIKAQANGCMWNIQFEDDSNITGLNIPDFYDGTDNCYFAENEYYEGIPGPQVSNENDAFQVAVLKLLEQLDLNNNDKIDVLFTEQDLQIDLSQVTGIPFVWSTEVQIRIWR